MRTTLPLACVLVLSACKGDPDDTSDTNDTVDTNDTIDTASGCGTFEPIGDNACVVSGTLLDDVTLTADKDWLLRGGVFVGDDTNETVLTIEAGTTVYGETSTDGLLVVRRGSKLVADGTSDAPIVFTSSQAPGSRAAGDWGGLILNGRAPINACSDPDAADCEAFGEGGTGWYGGDQANDSSGTLRYVRVEFAGTLISPDNELNGIAFQGVGSGTTVDFVQIHQNDDDGVEFFGGTVTAKHVLVTGVSDDGIDWTDGWQGKLQFAIVQQWPGVGDNGIESDNNAEDNDASPRSKPTISNVTLVGSPGSTASDLGMLLREGTAGELANFLVVGFDEACLDVDHAATFAVATSGELDVHHTWLSCNVSFVEDSGEPSVQDWFLAGTGNGTTDPGLRSPYDPAAPDFRPGSAASSGASVPSDAFFDDVAYLGAVDPASDWTAGWTTHAAN